MQPSLRTNLMFFSLNKKLIYTITVFFSVHFADFYLCLLHSQRQQNQRRTKIRHRPEPTVY